MDAFDLILYTIRAGFTWLTEVLEASGHLSFLVGILIFGIVFDKILSPILRGRGSDRADRRLHRKGEK